MWSRARFSGNIAGCLNAYMSDVVPFLPTAYDQMLLRTLCSLRERFVFRFTPSAPFRNGTGHTPVRTLGLLNGLNVAGNPRVKTNMNS